MIQLLLPTLLATIPPAAGSPFELVETFVRRVNEHDVEATLAMLAPDFEFHDADRTFVIRRGGVRPMIEWDAAVRARAEATLLQEDGERVEVRLVERNEFLTALDLGSLSHRVGYVVDAPSDREGGRIRRIVLLEADRVASRTAAALEPVVEWAGQQRPEELAALMVDGSPVYTGESAPGWLRLLAAARAAGVIETGVEP